MKPINHGGVEKIMHDPPSPQEQNELGMCTEELEDIHGRVWGGLMEARNTDRNILDILDPIINSMFDDF